MPKQTAATDPHREDQKHSAQRKPAQATQASGPAPDAAPLQRLPENPATASTSDMAQLQARYGNRAVQQLLSSRTVQAKLEVGPADDPYERKADEVAKQVMRMPAGKEDEEKPAA